MNKTSEKRLMPTLKGLWQAFVTIIVLVLVLGLIAGMWYLDHVRFVWP